MQYSERSAQRCYKNASVTTSSMVKFGEKSKALDGSSQAGARDSNGREWIYAMTIMLPIISVEWVLTASLMVVLLRALAAGAPSWIASFVVC